MKKLLLLCLLFLSPLGAKNSDSPESEAIRAVLATKYHSPMRRTVEELYRADKMQALWTGPENARRFASLLRALDAPDLNYPGKNFNQNAIKSLAFSIDNGQIPPEQLPAANARLDVLMSDAFVRLLRFVRIGDVDWELVRTKLKLLKERYDIDAQWEIHPKKMPSTAQILEAIRSRDIAEYLHRQLPLQDQYRRLLALRNKYLKMPDFPRIPFGRTLHRGDSDPRIEMIKKRLRFFGDYPRHASIDTMFDGKLARAIRHFKARFKIEPSTAIDNATIHYLNTDKREYLRKLRVNLEKLKLYPPSFERRHVEVNVPEYRLRYREHGRTLFSSDVVVGRIDRPTPIFESKIRYMVLNPTWTIPENLVRKDLIPALRRNPDYLREHNIHVFSGKKEVEPDLDKLLAYEETRDAIPYRFVQYPSAQNALGKVKFMFPNKYAVYLHDTDNKKLFGYRYRVFSSGCMRVARPFDFMQLLLQVAGGGYDAQKIQQILESNRPTTIRLKTPIPVHIVYFTVRRDGDMDYFLYDIYMYDQMIWESMAGHKKSGFTPPKHRLVTIKKRGNTVYIQRKF